MGATGDFAKLSALRANLRQLTTGGMKREISDELGRTSMKLIADEFRAERDPYGAPWAPLSRERARDRRARISAQRQGRVSKGQKILQRTGRMAASRNFQPTANGFVVNIPVSYAVFHQLGTVRMVQRMMLPSKDRGLGPIWLEAYNTAAEAMLRRKMGAVA